jgi:putative ABC transport system substrate-binding protein
VAWLPAAVVVVFVAAPLMVSAQPATKVARIGVLTLSTASWAPNAEGFRQGLRELGWVEGQSLALEHRDAAGRADRLP